MGSELCIFAEAVPLLPAKVLSLSLNKALDRPTSEDRLPGFQNNADNDSGIGKSPVHLKADG